MRHFYSSKSRSAGEENKREICIFFSGSSYAKNTTSRSSFSSFFSFYIIMSSKSVNRCRLVSFIVLTISTTAIFIIIVVQVKNAKKLQQATNNKQDIYDFTCASTCEFLTQYNFISLGQHVN